jgi:NitT/TauT family transport system substrate-binding protein
MTTRRKIAIAVIALIAAFSCRKETPAPAPKPKLTKVSMNLNPVMTYAPLMIAMDEGFFAQEGIEIDVAKLDSNSAVAATAAGKLDVLNAGVRSGVFNTIARGVAMRVVADKGHVTDGACSADAFVAPVAMADRIAKNGGRLKGERIAILRGGLAEFLTARLVESRGATLNDVTILQLPTGTPATTRDMVDAVRLTTEPNLSAIMHDGWAKVVATAQDVAPNHQFAVLVFGKRLLQEDRDLGRRFMRAYLRGVHAYNQGKTDRNVAIIARHTKLPEEIIRRACWVSVREDARIRAEAVQPFLDWAVTNKLLDRPMRFEEWWDPTFLDAAQKP